MKKVLKIPLGLLCALLCIVWFGIVAFPSYAAINSGNGTLVSLIFPKQPDVSAQTLQEKVEQAQSEASEEAESLLDQEAIAAVEETKKAIEAIDEDKSQDAIQALERATGKLDILLARNPKLALIPLSSTVEIINVAPHDKQNLKEFRNQLKSAVNAKNYPAAREILDNLMSEVRTKIVNLPLADYPEAMKEAARLLETKQPELAKTVLQTALSTLVITEKTRPIPVINAQTELVGAIAVAETDKEDGIRLLEDARQDLQLAKELGYANGDREYSELDKTIENVEQKVRLNKDVASAFGDLQDKLDNFLDRISA